MKSWYGSEETFETLKMVAVENMLTVFVDGLDIVIPNSCFYPCDSWMDMLEKEEELKKLRIQVEWLN